jgi:NAD(P)-dependent dehydrogenase (short-subunit alcohol dehydrogenase family)
MSGLDHQVVLITGAKGAGALVHVMGGFAGGTPIPETDDETWDLMMNLNLRAAFNVLRAVIPPMRHAGRGRIVAISSRQAVEPAPNLSAYNTSKAALVALIRTALLENKDVGITANTIQRQKTGGVRSQKPEWQPGGVPRRFRLPTSDL